MGEQRRRGKSKAGDAGVAGKSDLEHTLSHTPTAHSALSTLFRSAKCVRVAHGGWRGVFGYCSTTVYGREKPLNNLTQACLSLLRHREHPEAPKAPHRSKAEIEGARALDPRTDAILTAFLAARACVT